MTPSIDTVTEPEVRLALPWPDKLLSPNARAHHFARARAAKGARKLAWGMALAALQGKAPAWPAVALHWTFHPKTANRVDDDNAEASCKAYRDGIADALGMDDANFTTTRSMGPPVKGGSVLVTVTRAA